MVASGNHAPVAQAAVAAGLEDAVVISVTPASSDVDAGDSASYTVNSLPAHGTVSFNEATGNFDYVPAANFNGTDTFTYKVTDGSGATSVATATITVGAVNDAPVAQAAAANVNEGAVVITGNVVANDIDSATLTYALNAAAPAGLTFNANGSYSFDAGNSAYNALAAGATETVTVSYTVTDGALTDSKDLVITITGTNDAPVAQAAVAAGLEDAAVISVTPASSDVDTGDTAAYAVNSLPAHGTVSFNEATGNFDYVPAANFNGTDTFTYKVTDGSGATSVATATITVGAVNDAPVAQAAAANVNEGAVVITGNVVANDIDSATLTYALNAAAPAGLTFNANGSYSFDAGNSAYNALAAGATETVTVSYTVTDGALTDSKDLVITITGTNDAPVAQAVVGTGLQGAGIILLTPVSSDVDTDDTATYSVNSQPSFGSVSFNALSGKFEYLPNATYSGTDSFTYKVTDSQGATSVATASVTTQQTIFNLTTGIDNVVGSGSVDTINANAATLNPGDIINGGLGKDTLVFSNTATSAADINLASLQISGVEQLKATADGSAGGNVNFDLSGVTGLTTVTDTNSTNNVSFNQLTNLVNLEVANLTSANTSVTVQFQDSVVSGSTDAISVTLNSNQAMNNINIGQVSGANTGIETVNLVSNGSANKVDTLNTSLTTLNISGAASLSVNDRLINTVKVIDASAASGALNLNFANNDASFQGVTFTGSSGVNTIRAGDASDNITGGASADSLNAAEGDNTVVGLAGADTITAGAGNDSILGGDGADNIDAGNGDNFVDGGADGDTITAGAGNDSILGGDGADIINAGNGDNFVDGGADNDVITTGSGRDSILGGEGDDSIDAAFGGADTEQSNAATWNIVDGGAGNDTITSGNGTDSLVGGDGDDTINTGMGGGFYAGPVAETISGGNGNDIVNAQGGYKDIDLGDGTDIANFGNNILNNSIIKGGMGEDTVRTEDVAQFSSEGDVGAGFGSGSLGVEVLQFSTSTSGVLSGLSEDQNTNAAGVQTYQFQANLDGDVSLLNINNNANVDFLNGGTNLGGQNVTLSNVTTGGTVNVNVVTSAAGSSVESLDTLDAGNNEVANLNVANGNAQGLNVDTLTIETFSSTGATTLNITNVIADHAGLHSGFGTTGDSVTINAFATPALTLVDGSTVTGNVTALGSSFTQDVTMKGGAGNDSLVSGSGNDVLIGNDGNDTLVAGTGVDNVSGGDGNDVFQFKDSELTAADRIDGGDGDDTVAITSGSVYLGDASFYRWDSVETIDLSATALAGTNTLVLGAIAQDASIDNIIGGNGNDKIVFVEGYVSPITITLGGGNDTVNGDFYVDQLSLADTAYLYPGQITIKANVSEVNALDTLQGVTGTGDVLQFTADGGTADLQNVIGFDSLAVAGSGSATINMVNANVVAGQTFEVTSTTTGDLIFNGGAETDGQFNLTSGNGNDEITTGALADTISTGAGNDTIVSGAGNDIIDAGAGNDMIVSGTGNDSINAGDGNDQINGGTGNDTINAGAGDDVIVGGAGLDVVDAGAGADTIVTEGGETIQVGASDGDADMVGISATSISGGIPAVTTINGWGSEDTLRISTVLVTGAAQGTASTEHVQGDIINAATDRLVTLSTPAGAAANTAVGVASFLQTNNLASFAFGQRAVFALNDGTNTQLWLYTSDGSVNTNATEFTNIGLLNGYTGIVNMAAEYGFTNFADTAFVTAGSTVDGLGGNDAITLTDTGTITMTGIELVTGTAGNDTFTFNDATTASAYGNGGTDVWNMGAGQSLTVFSTGTVNGNSGTETLTLGEGSPTLHTVTVNNVEAIVGSSQADTITFGTSAAATVTGNGGVDVVNLNAAGQIVTITSVESVVGGAGTDTVILTAGQSTTISSVESVDGTAGAGNSITLMDGGQTTTVNAVESVNGGMGNDNVTLAAGGQTTSVGNVETVTGGTGDDAVTFLTNAAATVLGNGGNDTVNLANGNQTVTMDSVKTVNGGTGADNVVLAAGGQTTSVGNVETVTGGTGNDAVTFLTNAAATVLGNGGNDTVNLANGNQTVTIDSVETVNGGTGADNVTLAAGGQTTSVDNVETVTGGTGDDAVTFLTNAAATVNGNGGNDTVTLANGNQKVTIDSVETVNGGTGADTVILAAGGQTTSVGNVETVIGGNGNDIITADNVILSVDGGLGNDLLNLNDLGNTISVADVEVINGGTGDDIVSFTTNVMATVNASGGNDMVNMFSGGQTVTVDQVETVNGGAGDDVIIYTSSTTATINAAGGDDRLVLADGGQTVTVGSVETVTGGDGNDSITYTTATTATIDGGIGNDTLTLGDGGQTVLVSNVELINGGTGDDAITLANNTVATVNGGAGNDTVNLTAAGGTVTVNGDVGNDIVNLAAAGSSATVSGVETVNGGAGDDLVDARGNVNAITIVAGLGNDTLLGGAAGDTFQFAGNALTASIFGATDIVDGNGGQDTLEIISSGTVDLGRVSSVETLKLEGTSHTVSDSLSPAREINSGIRTVNLTNAAATTVTFGDQLGAGFTVTINGTNTSDIINLATDGGFFFADNNRVLVLDGGASINAGAGNDTISAAGSDAGVTFNSGTGDDRLTGSSFNDVFKFAGNALTGNDTVAGGGHAVGSFDTIELTSAGNATFTNVSAVNAIQLDVTGTYTLNNTGGMGLASINGSGFNDVITMNTAAALANVTVSGNDGFDTLNLAAGGNTVSVNTVETVNGGTGADVLTFTGAGMTTISGGATTASLSGNDTFILSAASDIQTILFGNTAANNGEDTIIGFKAGAGGDLLNFDAFLGAATNLSIGSSFVGNPGGLDGVDVSGTVFRLIDQNAGQDMDLAAGFTAGVSAAGEYANINMLASSKAVALVANDALSGTQLEVMYLTSDSVMVGGQYTITATLVGTITLEAGQSINSFTTGALGNVI